MQLAPSAAALLVILAAPTAAQGSSYFGDPPPQSTQQYFVIFDPASALLPGDEVGAFDLQGLAPPCQPGEVLTGATLATPTTIGQGLTVAAMGVDVFGCSHGWLPGNPVVLRLWRPSTGTLYELIPSQPLVYGNLGVDLLTSFQLVPHALSPDLNSLSLAQGGSQSLQLDADAAQAGSLYLLMGSASGSSPGLQVDAALLPLNLDSYTLFTIQNPGTPPLSGSVGFLDGSGRALAGFGLPVASAPGLAGLQLHHAYLLLPLTGAPVSFASNAAALELVP